MLTYDVLIVGSGGAGLYAALEARREDVSVAVLSKVYATRSHTGAAQAESTAALATADRQRHWEDHFFDTVKGADYWPTRMRSRRCVAEAPMGRSLARALGLPFLSCGRRAHRAASLRRGDAPGGHATAAGTRSAT